MGLQKQNVEEVEAGKKDFLRFADGVRSLD